MRKGKFGIVLCCYPILAFAAVILQAFWFCLLILAAAVFLEKDEWTGRQSLQAGFLAVIVWCFRAFSQALSGLIYVPILTELVRVAATTISVVVYLGALVLSIFAILRVMKEQEANLPLLSDLAYRVYGIRPVRPISYSQPYGQPPVPQFPQQSAPPVPNGEQPAPPETPEVPESPVRNEGE